MKKRARVVRFVPVPKKKPHDKSRVGVGPRRIEIHVNGKRAGPPNPQSGEQGPALVNVLAREPEGNEQGKKTAERRTQRHGDAIRRREAVGRNGRAQRAREENAGVRDEEKGSPENRRSHCEVVFEVTGARAKFRGWLVVFVETIFAEAGVGLLIIRGEIEIVLDERGARESVVADAVSAYPGIEQGKREQKEHQKKALRFARRWLRQRGQALRLRDRSTRNIDWLRVQEFTGQNKNVLREKGDVAP